MEYSCYSRQKIFCSFIYTDVQLINSVYFILTFIAVGDILTAFRLSPEEFQAKYGVPKPKITDENLIFHCQSGRRAQKAVKAVQQLGFEK